ncbi:MAG: hypothetical protein H5U40_17175, partial [Polyangiaceae bacterium]|nr:hypothetical protein [Polyangiaceae bacterium]
MNLEFQFLRIPVRVHLWFLLSAVLLGTIYIESASPAGSLAHARWLAVWVAIVFQGIFCHEVGHALVGRAFGLRPRIDLVAFGGQTGFHGTKPLTAGRALLVSAAGPGVSVGVGIAALAAFSSLGLPIEALFRIELAREGLGTMVVKSLVHVNLFWGIFNLLPLLPLDGGQILVSLGDLAGKRRGRLVAIYLSLFLSVLAALAGIALTLPFLAIIAALSGFTSYQFAKRERLGPASNDPLAEAQEALRAGHVDRVLELGTHLFDAAESDAERDEALHLVAWARVLGGQP